MSLDAPKEERTTEPLKPCPFCGAEVHTIDITSVMAHAVLWYVTHPDRDCIFGTGAVSIPFYTEADAIAAWNRRSA